MLKGKKVIIPGILNKVNWIPVKADAPFHTNVLIIPNGKTGNGPRDNKTSGTQ